MPTRVQCESVTRLGIPTARTRGYEFVLRDEHTLSGFQTAGVSFAAAVTFVGLLFPNLNGSRIVQVVHSTSTIASSKMLSFCDPQRRFPRFAGGPWQSGGRFPARTRYYW